MSRYQENARQIQGILKSLLMTRAYNYYLLAAQCT